MTIIQTEGKTAYLAQIDVNDNPYEDEREYEWRDGWIQALVEHLEYCYAQWINTEDETWINKYEERSKIYEYCKRQFYE